MQRKREPRIESEAATTHRPAPSGVRAGNPAPSSVSGGLRIGQPNDAYEQEADRVASEVMSGGVSKRHWSLPRPAEEGSVQRKCSCGASGGSGGECEQCKQEKEEQTVQRKASGAAPAAVAPPIVRQVLNSPGMPLDTATREYFEPRFGHDFSRVRIHSDAHAAKSAREVHALAYTVGPDVVFGDSQFDPNSRHGVGLLAHELTHVIQQGEGSGLVQRFVPAEAEAEAEEDVEEDEPLGEHETQETPSGGQPGRVGGHRHATSPSPFSLRGRIEAHRRAQTADDFQFEKELPEATTDRGGSADKDFQEQKPKQTASAATTSGMVTVQFTPTVFHMLDAMEADIARAQSKEDILDIYLAYFKDSAATPPASAKARTRFRTFADKIPTYGVPPEQADPNGTQRTTVFVTAVKRRTDIDPNISTEAALESIIRGLVEFETQQAQKAAARAGQNQGPCQQRPVPRKGGNKDHDDYAKFVTGQDMDFEVAAPGGPKCAFDGQDSSNPNVVWEVKTRHEWSTPQVVATGIFNPNIQDAILNMESQLERCKSVAERCGLTYKWAFENQNAADFMKILWSGRVEVVHRPRGPVTP